MTDSAQPSEVAPPKRLLPPCLLLLIGEAPAHGYDLIERLHEFGFERDAGGLYRALRGLEIEGVVKSHWEHSSHGPGRRTYELTDTGWERLAVESGGVVELRVMLDAFVQRYDALEKVHVHSARAAPAQTPTEAEV
jgi:PadR family transcriptional regulator PadR